MSYYFAFSSQDGPYEFGHWFVVESPWDIDELACRLKEAFSLGSALFYEEWRCLPAVEELGPERAWTLLSFHQVVYWAVKALVEKGEPVRILPVQVVPLDPPVGLFVRRNRIGNREGSFPESPVYQAFRDWLEEQDGAAGHDRDARPRAGGTDEKAPGSSPGG